MAIEDSLEPEWDQFGQALIGQRVISARVHTFYLELKLENGTELTIDCEEGWMHYGVDKRDK